VVSGVAPTGPQCTVCGVALEAATRSSPQYRKLLAGARAGVCVAHLTPGVHLVEGKRVRYCTNHHCFHNDAEFGVGSRATSQTTCARARSLSLARIKRQRTATTAAAANEEGALPGGRTAQPLELYGPPPCAGVSSLLQVPLPLPVEWQGADDVEEALLGWPWSDNNDDFSPVLQLEAPAETAAALVPCSDVTTSFIQSDQFLAVSVLNNHTVKETTTHLHSLATSPQTASLLCCFAGGKAKAHVEECAAAVAQYVWVRRLFAGSIMQRHTHMITALHERLRHVVKQARQDVLTGGTGAAEELDRVLDTIHSMATRRSALLNALSKRTNILSPSLLLMAEEFRDGNAVHLRNASLLRDLLRSGAESGHAGVHAEVVRQVAEFAVVQLGLVRDALAERAAWLDALAAPNRRFDIRNGLEGLWQSVQHSWDGLLIID
jgi:hypothetical protein